MQDRILQALIRQTVEMDELAFARRAQPVAIRFSRIARAAIPIAAAVLLPLFLSPFGQKSAPHASHHPGSNAAMVSVDYLAAGSHSRAGTIHSCAQKPAMALVLLRIWEEDCQCIAWKLHENPDGSSWVVLHPDEPLDIPLEPGDAPAVEQAVLLAVSSDANPTETDAEQLLTCLNRECPAVWPGEEALADPSEVLPCLPSGVTLVRRSFVAD